MSSEPPRNFSWFVEGKLAGMGYPMIEHFPFLAKEGIKTLVNLTSHDPSTYEEDSARASEVAVHSINIQDFTPPTLEQIEQFLQIVGNAESVMATHSLKKTVFALTLTTLTSKWPKCFGLCS